MIGLLTMRVGCSPSSAWACSSRRSCPTRASADGRAAALHRRSVWLTNAIAFGLAFWELDCGGPVARALAAERPTPDFQFPQDENPELARDGWLPRLWDYLYVSLTNSIAFSPTDAMPLTRRQGADGSRIHALRGDVLLVASRA